MFSIFIFDPCPSLASATIKRSIRQYKIPNTKQLERRSAEPVMATAVKSKIRFSFSVYRSQSFILVLSSNRKPAHALELYHSVTACW